MLTGLSERPWLALLVLAGLSVAAITYWRRREDKHSTWIPTFGLGVLQRYVLREAIGPIFLSAITLTFFLLAQKLYKLIDLMMSNASGGEIFKILLAMLPTILSLTIPISILLGLLLGIGRMAVDNEIQACQTAGVNVAWIFWPLFVVCFMLSGVIMYSNFEYTPRMLRQGEELKAQLAYQALSSLPPGIPTKVDSEGGEIIFYFREREEGVMKQVALLVERERLEEVAVELDETGVDAETETESVASPVRPPAGGAWAVEPGEQSSETDETEQDSDEQDQAPKMIRIREHFLFLAASGEILPDLDNKTVIIELRDGSIHDLGEDLDGEILAREIEEESVAMAWGGGAVEQEPMSIERESINRFDTFHYPITVDSDGTNPNKASLSTVAEMLKRIGLGNQFEPWAHEDELEIQEKQREYWAEIAFRTAIPLSCVAFALLGVPLAIFVRPTGKSVGLTLTFGLILVYYWMIKWGRSMAVDGQDIGFLVIFLPNVAMAGLGLIMLRRAVRL